MTKKHNVSICAIAKNEGKYLLEWIAYHSLIGFDHIYLYDNDSTDNTQEILSRAAVRAFVTTTPWPRIDGQKPQYTAYEHFLRNFALESEWVAVIDLDEFIRLKTALNIKDFLKQHQAERIGALGISWRIFGDAGQADYVDELVTKRFTKSSMSDFGPNHLGKPILRPECVDMIGAHTCKMKNGFSFVNPAGQPLKPFPAARQDFVADQHIQINHYFCKTREEWEAKKARGNVASGQANNIREDGDFDFHNRNDVDDASMRHYEEALLREMKRLVT